MNESNVNYVVKAINAVVRESRQDHWKNEKAENVADPTVETAGRSASAVGPTALATVPAGKDVVVDVMMDVASGVRNGVEYFAVKA